MRTDWTEKMSPFMWLGLMAGVLIGVSIVVNNDQYINLWFLTFIYSVAGYALDVAFERDRHPKLRCTFLSLSTIIYIILFIFIRFIIVAEPSFPVMD